MASPACACMVGSVAERYAPLRKHPSLFEPRILPEWLSPTLPKLIAELDSAEAETAEDVVAVGTRLGAFREEAGEVYSFQCFSPEFSRLFNDEIEHFFSTGLPVRRPNSMNNYGLIVNEIGMRPMISALQREYLWPIARRLFPSQGSRFDSHHAFIVRYTKGEDLGLDMHTDDSQVTFNVCLGHDFTASTLTFCGDIGTPSHRHVTHVYEHSIGRAVMHLGTRRHGADDIASGTRVNLIVWNQNSEWQRDHPNGRPGTSYHAEDGKPDLKCLSFTHDRDYLTYRAPPGGRKVNPRAWCPPRGAEYPGFHNVFDPNEH